MASILEFQIEIDGLINPEHACMLPGFNFPKKYQILILNLCYSFFSGGTVSKTLSREAWDKVKNGSEDNIAFWVQGYKEHIDKGRQIKGYRALII